MQFKAIVALAFAAVASAQYNGTAVAPTGTAAPSASGGSGAANPTTSPIDNGANTLAGSALAGLVAVGGVALAL